MKKVLIIYFVTLVLLGCEEKYSLKELKGNYYEVDGKNGLNLSCKVTITDSTLTIIGCTLLKEIYGKNPKIIHNNKVSFFIPDYKYSTAIEVTNKKGELFLVYHLEENTTLTFKKNK